MACFTGEYPQPVPLQMDKLAMEPHRRLAATATSPSTRYRSGGCSL